MDSWFPFSETLKKCNNNKTFEKAKITWTIENFLNLSQINCKCLESPTFNSIKNDKIKWSLCLYPYGDEKGCDDIVSVYLCLNEMNRPEVTSMFIISILNKEGKKECTKEEALHKFVHNNDSWGYPKFVVRDLLIQKKDKFLPNDKLTLVCEVFYYCGSIISLVPMSSNKLGEPLGLFFNDMSSLLETSKFSDCIIKVNDCDIKVHKCILASRSKVFDSLLDSENSNSPSNIITINNYSLEVVKEMINYLYTEKLPNIKKMAIEMLKIGEEFKLDGIKLEALKCILNSLNTNNVLDYVELCELYYYETLKEWCIRFIYQNIEMVKRNEKWMEFVKKYPLIIAKLFLISVDVED